jgi:hypothetical protein
LRRSGVSSDRRRTTVAAPAKVRRVEGSLGVILPKDVVESLGVTPYDPNFAQAIESTRDYMRSHRNAMHDLVKK